MNEKWTDTLIPIECKGRRYTLKLQHYQSWDTEYPREWYRVYPEGFDSSAPASSQLFGYGKTQEQAMDSFFTSFDRKIW